jgi:hypothetical protein
VFIIIVLACIVVLTLSLLIYEVWSRKSVNEDDKIRLRVYHHWESCTEPDDHVVHFLDLNNLPPCFELEAEGETCIVGGEYVQVIVKKDWWNKVKHTKEQKQ